MELSKLVVEYASYFKEGLEDTWDEMQLDPRYSIALDVSMLTSYRVNSVDLSTCKCFGVQTMQQRV